MFTNIWSNRASAQNMTNSAIFSVFNNVIAILIRFGLMSFSNYDHVSWSRRNPAVSIPCYRKQTQTGNRAQGCNLGMIPYQYICVNTKRSRKEKRNILSLMLIGVWISDGYWISIDVGLLRNWISGKWSMLQPCSATFQMCRANWCCQLHRRRFWCH